MRIVQDDLAGGGLKVCPKLNTEHVYLTAYSVMSVSKAAQVLSYTVARVLREYYGPNTEGTAELCQYMDNFFDCLNARNQSEGDRKRKEFLAPYRDVNDHRFDWLTNDFLEYLRKWKQSIADRPGNFTANARDRMFLSWQTYEGLRITVKSTIESVRFLLESGMPFVLTERFNQDVVEEYFGRQRQLGQRNDNPIMYQFWVQ